MEQPNWWEVGASLSRAADNHRQRGERGRDDVERITDFTAAAVLDALAVAIRAHTPKPY